MKLDLLIQAHSRARKGSKTSYPMDKKGKIPGTNIQHGEGLSGVENIARQGRKGDTELREVGGTPSHVNKQEAQVIDYLGPLGEAWVQSIGAGTTNPKTGLPEYWRWKMGTWKPSEGKWGVFGATDASKERDDAASAERKRQSSFDEFLVANKDKNVLDEWGSHEDIKDKVTDFTGGKWDVGVGMDDKDFDLYIDKYDSRHEDESKEKLERTLEQGRLASDKSAEQGQQGLFGMLTQSQAATGQKGFAGSGNFAQDFKQDALMDDIENTAASQEINRQGVIADAESHVQDLRDNYNDQFWTQMTKFDELQSG